MTVLFGILVFLFAFNAELQLLIIPLEISIQVITILAIFVLIIALVAIIGVGFIAIVVLIIFFHNMESVCHTVVQVFFTIQILQAVNHVPLIAKIVIQAIHAKFVCQALF